MAVFSFKLIRIPFDEFSPILRVHTKTIKDVIEKRIFSRKIFNEMPFEKSLFPNKSGCYVDTKIMKKARSRLECCDHLFTSFSAVSESAGENDKKRDLAVSTEKESRWNGELLRRSLPVD